MLRRIFLFTSFMMFGLQLTHGQILISLLLGDKLNSGKVEFGLDGGLALSNISGIDDTQSNSSLHLGFYFDIKTKGNMLIHTGVIVKSQMGARNIAYNLDDPELDPLFMESTAKRELNYFSVPVYIKYKIYNQFFIEAGPQIGLLYRAKDKFETQTGSGKALTMQNDVKEQYTLFDMGLAGGVGYKLMKGTGINLGVRYYHGLLNIAKKGIPAQHNRTFYIYAGIPIGAGKKNEIN
ncbi:porin family protein [Zhouia amylolytica]|uniref:Outer membrane protein beta-barrel domain-containing protein n=1 Tax=Zhouia amylolytica AD3 TaxID=1286632 RepID=W2UL79_9FLAO|nr:porin family protein [Zhouia amylolytica]ETN94196.1 hypothetical protein P278_30000 [Zhouia amylolytica AD3]